MRSPMTRSRIMSAPEAVVALLIALMLLTTPACSRFRLAEVPPEQIPLEVTKDRQEDEVIWRACYEQDDCTIVWWEWVEPKSLAMIYSYGVYRRDEGGALALEDGFGHSHWEPPYDWVRGSGEGQIHASGLAFTTRAHRAVGQVSDRKVEGPVVNGFWYLAAYDPPFGEGWVKIEIHDDQGRVIATLRP